MAAPSDDDPTLRTTAVLTARRDAGGGVSLVTLTPPVEATRAYRAPGQYIKVHAESGGYFVLASEVGAPSWELLVRNSGGAADALTHAPEGTTFDVTGPLGVGFPLASARGRPLVIAVVGSAIAVARPILRERIAERACASTTVYIGARSPRDVPLGAEVAGWARAGARLVLCLSRPDLDDPNVLAAVPRRHGWVQQVLAADLAEGRIASGVAFAAGPAAMLDELRELPSAGPAGGPTLEVHTNV